MGGDAAVAAVLCGFAGNLARNSMHVGSLAGWAVFFATMSVMWIGVMWLLMDLDPVADEPFTHPPETTRGK